MGVNYLDLGGGGRVKEDETGKLTDDGETEHVLPRRDPAESHAADKLEGASGGLQKTRPERIEPEPLDEGRGEVGDTAVEDAGADAHQQEQICLAVQEGLLDMIRDQRFVLNAHLVLRHSPHGDHALVLGEHLGVVGTVGKVEEDNKAPSESQRAHDLSQGQH